MFIKDLHKRYRKLIAGLFLIVLVMGPVVCSLTINHRWMHSGATNSLCLTERIVTSMQAAAPNSLTILFGLVMLLMAAAVIEARIYKVELHNRWPAVFLRLHYFRFLPRNYILLALGQGILHSRVY